MKRQLLLSLMAILLAGCSNRPTPGTEMMLSESGALHLSSDNLVNGHNPPDVRKGTRVRIVRDLGKDILTPFIEIYILEGANKDENATVDPDHLLPIEKTP